MNQMFQIIVCAFMFGLTALISWNLRGLCKIVNEEKENKEKSEK